MSDHIPPVIPRQGGLDIETLCRIAESQGAAWQRCGFDVHAKIRRHVPAWRPGREERIRLTLAVLDGARRARSCER